MEEPDYSRVITGNLENGNNTPRFDVLEGIKNFYLTYRSWL
jgi:hypothetical protein